MVSRYASALMDDMRIDEIDHPRLGGGYTAPAGNGHMRLLWSIFQTTRLKEPHFAIFIQSYTLSGLASYPTQLRQAAISLQYLLKETRLPPSSIVLCGDSAGGHLLLSLLSHLLHPYPDKSIPEITLDHAFAGSLLVSPWTSYDFESGSFTRNRLSDSLTKSVMERIAADLKRGAKSDEYNEADFADPAWWKGLNGVSGPIAVTAGADEVLLDGIKSTVGKMREGIGKGTERVEFMVFEKEAHDLPLFAWELGQWWVENSGSLLFVQAWVKDKIVGS